MGLYLRKQRHAQSLKNRHQPNIACADHRNFHEPTTLKTFPFEMIQARQTVNNQSKFLEFSTKWHISGHIPDLTLKVVQHYALLAANGLNFA